MSCRKLKATLKRRSIGAICSCDLHVSGFIQAIVVRQAFSVYITFCQLSVCLQKLAVCLFSRAMQNLSGFGLPVIWSSWVDVDFTLSHDDHSSSGRPLLPTLTYGEAEMIQRCSSPHMDMPCPGINILFCASSGFWLAHGLTFTISQTIIGTESLDGHECY